MTATGSVALRWVLHGPANIAEALGLSRTRQPTRFVFVVQRGRLEREAILLVESALRNGGLDPSQLIAAHPTPGPLWAEDPTPSPKTLAFLRSRGVRLLPFVNEHFGASYPHSNKMYALRACGEGFAFFVDTDTFFVRPFVDTVSHRVVHVRRGGQTFPNRESEHGPDEIWAALYALFGQKRSRLMAGRRMKTRYPYFNAGAIGVPNPRVFAETYLDTARRIADETPAAVRGQELFPWLDQIALPITLHRLNARVSVIRKGINFSGASDHVALWHYHYVPRLLYEGGAAFGDAIHRVVDDPDVRAALDGDGIFAFWSGPQGRARYDEATADEPLASRRLVKALKESVGKKQLR